MTAHYTQAEANTMNNQAQARGEYLDLVRCSDGIMRTREDADQFERSRHDPHALTRRID